MTYAAQSDSEYEDVHERREERHKKNKHRHDLLLGTSSYSYHIMSKVYFPQDHFTALMSVIPFCI